MFFSLITLSFLTTSHLVFHDLPAQNSLLIKEQPDSFCLQYSGGILVRKIHLRKLSLIISSIYGKQNTSRATS